MTASKEDLEFIEQVMSEVRRNWNVVLQDNFNPIMIALELLQQSNPAHNVESFMRLDAQLAQAMNIVIDNYYTGFNDAVSIFGGVVQGMRECRERSARLEEDFDKIGGNIAFKRSDLSTLLESQQASQRKVRVNELVKAVNVRRVEAVDLLAKRSFVKAQMALSDCLTMLADIDDDRADVCMLQAQIAETKKYFTNTLSDELRRYVFLTGSPERRSVMFQLTAQLDDSVAERMLRIGLLERHQEAELVAERREIDALVTAMNEIGVLHETVRLLAQRLPLELHKLTRECVEDALGRYRQASWRGLVYRPFLVQDRLKRSELVEAEGFAPILHHLAELLFVKHAVVYLGFQVVFSQHLSKDDPIWATSRAALVKEANDFVMAFTSASHAAVSTTTTTITTTTAGFGLGPAEVFKPAVPKPSGPVYEFRLTAPKHYTPPLVKSLHLSLTEKERDSASKLAALTAVDQYSSTWMRNSLDIGVSPNVQYLPILTGPYCMLMDWAGIEDHRFVDKLITANYLPFLEAHCIQTMAFAFSPSEVARHVDISDRRGMHLINDESSRVLVHTTATSFCSIFDSVCAALYHLQVVQPEIEKLLVSLLAGFLEKCRARMKALLTCSREGGEDSGSISQQMAQSKDLRALLTTHPNLAGQFDHPLELEIALKEIAVMEHIKTDRSLVKAELLGKADTTTQICIFYQSLKRLPFLFARKTGRLSGLTSVYKDKSDGRLYCAYLGVEPNELFTFSESFASQLDDFVAAVDAMAQECLLIARCECRVLCMYYLDLAFREGHYHVHSLEQLSDGPDANVNQLCGALVQYRQSVRSACLDHNVQSFIFSGLDACVEHLLIGNVRHIRGPIKARDLGLAILRANLDAMEQVLLAVLDDDRIVLSRTRTYYDLLQMTPEQFMQIVADAGSSRAFAPTEYQAILRVHYAAGGKDKELASQLVRLKYLLDNKA